MATIETLRDDNLQTLPQDLTDQEAQTVIFTPESTKGEEGYNFSSEEIREAKEDIDGNLIYYVNKIKDTETVKGWKWAENLVDGLYNDIKNIFLDDKTINLFLVSGDIRSDKSDEDLKVIQEQFKTQIDKEKIRLYDELNNIIAKYINKLKDQLTSGLQNKFQDIPEPTRTKYVRESEKIMGLLHELGQCLTGCDIFSRSLKGKLELSETDENALDEWLDMFDDLLDDMENILFIEDIEKRLKDTCTQLESIISSKNGKLDWGKKRGHIEFDDDKYVIKSWGKKVKVKSIGRWNLGLEGLNLDLYIEDGIWLANFKNRIKSKYGNRKVTLKGTDKPTFYIGPVKLIDYDTLDNYFYIPHYRKAEKTLVDTPEGKEYHHKYLETEKDVMKTICEWLNK